MAPTVADIYRARHQAKDAMSAHMPKLAELAAECDACVEFGIRRANSSAALLHGCPGEVHSYDLEILDKYRKIIDPLKAAAGDRWHIHVPQNSVTAEIPECDLLLHDSCHHYYQVMLELGMHGHKVRKYFVFHDTQSHGKHGQSLHNWAPKRSIKGIRPAIEKYARANDLKIVYDVPNDQGLMVLRRR